MNELTRPPMIRRTAVRPPAFAKFLFAFRPHRNLLSVATVELHSPALHGCTSSTLSLQPYKKPKPFLIVKSQIVTIVFSNLELRIFTHEDFHFDRAISIIGA